MLCLLLSVDYFVIPYRYHCRVTYRAIPTLCITIVIERLMPCLLLSTNYFVIPYRHRYRATYRVTHAVLAAVRRLFCHTLSSSLLSDLSSDSCRACRCLRTILSYFSHAFPFFLTLPHASSQLSHVFPHFRTLSLSRFLALSRASSRFLAQLF